MEFKMVLISMSAVKFMLTVL